jgi:hypothetical protein
MAGMRPLETTDFRFDGPLGSDGAAIEKSGRNHFHIELGAAPEHPTWPNRLQLRILGGAKGNDLRLDVTFRGGADYRFNEYHHSWSVDGQEWHPVHWQDGTAEAGQADTLLLPEFPAESVIVGHQVPMSYPDLELLVHEWSRSPHAAMDYLGTSLEGRPLYRLTITEAGTHPLPERWAHYFANQHPGEHNSQWRMAGMIDWLLSPEGADCRRRSICHFVMMMSPDGPSHGWYRNNAHGVDMNRTYRPDGADEDAQAHEAFICQRDLERLMASEAPINSAWSMHTWPGLVDCRILPGPECGAALGTWPDLSRIIQDLEGGELFDPIQLGGTSLEGSWGSGPHVQWGITTVLCEGAGDIDTKAENLRSGATLMEAIGRYYEGLRR